MKDKLIHLHKQALAQVQKLKAKLADRVAVINRGKIIEVSTPDQLGGRAISLATVSWRDGNQICSEKSANPTALVKKLAEQFGGEVPELNVKRASLEDIYLQMIGGADE